MVMGNSTGKIVLIAASKAKTTKTEVLCFNRNAVRRLKRAIATMDRLKRRMAKTNENPLTILLEFCLSPPDQFL